MISSESLVSKKIKELQKAAADDEQFTDLISRMIEEGRKDKNNLIALIRFFAPEQTEDYTWSVDLVASDDWTNEVNQRFWDEYWDGNLDGLMQSVNDCFNHFYPLD